MTAPDTNVEKQAKRHRFPLIAFALGILVAVGMAIFFAGADELAEDDATSVAPAELNGATD